MANLAIRGHETRGKEVIKILEMLGGENKEGHCGNNPIVLYYVDKSYENDIYCSSVYTIKDCVIFTLEEFLEKYPYKIGDKVKCWINGYCSINNIKSIQWDSITNEIKYKIQDYWYSTMNLQPYKEETMEKVKDNWAKWDLPDGYEFQDEEGNVIKTGVIKLVKKQPQYPKTYEECCEVLMGKTDFQDYSLLLTKLSTKINEANSISPEPPHITLINNFYKLLICRDAYWKIAGEQMGLGKPWEPLDDEYSHIKYVIQTIENEITCLDTWCKTKNILELPYKKMRDAFFTNFRELIVLCKELL